MSIDRVLAAAASQPWAIMPEKLAEIQAFFTLRADGVRFTSAEIEARIGTARTSEPTQPQGGVAVISVFGIISQRASMLSEISGGGGTSTERVGAAFRHAVEDPNTRAIVLEMDSPGGGVFGVRELFEEIKAARGRKPIVAQVNSLCASAAYWIASAAGEIVMTPGGEVGSIGVYTMHTNMAEMLKQMGLEKTYISAGEYKVEGNPLGPLSAEGQAYTQKQVNDIYDAFITSVAQGRGKAPAVVRADFGKGRTMGSKEALRVGMVDRIATMQETMRRLTISTGQSSRSSSALAVGADEHTARLRRHLARSLR